MVRALSCVRRCRLCGASPSRGCYWNRCAFCDYGLNQDAPTSPWRQDPVEKTVADLRELSTLARHIYLSVDVLGPATLHRLAERICEEDIDVRWGAEVRLEHYWTQDKCRDLAAAGCTAISVGLESGSQRVLDVIDKGTDVVHMARTIRAMAEAGVAVQVMAFTGFPSETRRRPCRLRTSWQPGATSGRRGTSGSSC